MGSLMIEENVVAEAGTVHYLTLEEIKGAIRELGYTPRQRNVAMNCSTTRLRRRPSTMDTLVSRRPARFQFWTGHLQSVSGPCSSRRDKVSY